MRALLAAPLLPRLALALSALALAAACHQPLPRATAGDTYPERTASGEGLRAGWRVDDGFLVSEALLAEAGATRVGFMLDVTADAAARTVALEARGDGGSWAPARITWVEHPIRVGYVDLDRLATSVEVRVPASDAEAIALLTFSAVIPEPRDAQELTVPDASGEPVVIDGVATPQVRQHLDIAGVQPRSAWNARATLCTSLNQTKTRISVHHTVTPASASGGYEVRIRGIQNYHMDSNGWCDIGYHFLVTTDGTAWEAREAKFLGTHVGGQNTNNLGVSFIGCFHPGVDPCTQAAFAPVVPPEVMIQGGGWLIGALANHYGISVNTSTVIGHRDNPGQSTSCPGNNLHSRLPDLRSIAVSGGGGGPEPDPPPTTGTVQGVVWDLSITASAADSAALGARLPGATLTVTGGSSTQARDGDAYWSFDLDPGFYTVTATLDGFAPATRDVQVTAGGELWASIGISPVEQAVTLTLAIYDASQGLEAGIESATVVVTGVDPAQTGADGRVELSVPAGEVTIVADAEGFDPVEQVETFAPGSTPLVEIGLTPTVVAEPDPEPEAAEPDPTPDPMPDAEPDVTADPEPEMSEPDPMPEVGLGDGDGDGHTPRVVIPHEEPAMACRCSGSGDADAGGPMLAVLGLVGVTLARRRRH